MKDLWRNLAQRDHPFAAFLIATPFIALLVITIARATAY